MDKAEYRVMLDRITALADAGDYTGALPIVEEIDWRRVKSVRTLCMVSEIYEANGRLEDSLRILKIAYKRASISKTVLYRLSEISAKLGNYKEAINYYREFEEISPMDNSKYILKYEIYRAKGASLEEQIRVLEEYKEREYTEQWAYELAELYSKAGMKDACVDTCDDLILWFSEGSYVFKAMELKKKYAPLTSSQAKKYQEQLVYHKPQAKAPEVSAYDLESKIFASTESIMSKNKAPEETVSVMPTSTESLNAEPVKPIDPVRMQTQLADSIRAVFSGINKEPDDYAAEMEDDADIKVYKSAETDMSGYEIKELEPETADGISRTEKAPVVKKEDGQIAGQMSLTDLQKPEEFDLEALIAETTSSLAQEVASGEFQMTDETIETGDELDRKAAEEEARKAAEEEAARKAAEEEAARKAAEEAARKAAEEEAARKAAEEEAARKAAEEAARKAAEEEAARKAAEEEARKAAEEEAARKVAEEEAARKAAEEEAIRQALEEVAREAEEESQIYEKETDETLGLTREFNFHEELKKSVEPEKADILPEAADELDITAALAEAAASLIKDADLKTEEESVEEAEEAAAEKIDLEELERLMQEDAEEPQQEFPEEDVFAEAESIVAEENPMPSKNIDFDLDLDFVEEEKRLKYVPVEPRELTEKEREIFSYFTKIPGMSQQITETICDVHNNAGDKTSRSGNFLIIGRQGSGKTKLYESMVLAICHDLGIEAVKMAKIIGRDLNKKDPVAVVSKLSGGFLVIEGAGELDDETVEKLSQAMEFRTDSLVVVLEDEKADLFAMLDRHPELAEKFTSSIKIPVFTNDELVTFAKTYASENGYKMDEMGVLALYTKIGDNQKDSEPVTVGKVKDIMDEAIEHANRGTRKFGRKFSKKAVDEDNRVLLLEKDFD